MMLYTNKTFSIPRQWFLKPFPGRWQNCSRFLSNSQVTPGRLPEAEHGLAAGMEVGHVAACLSRIQESLEFSQCFFYVSFVYVLSCRSVYLYTCIFIAMHMYIYIYIISPMGFFTPCLCSSVSTCYIILYQSRGLHHSARSTKMADWRCETGDGKNIAFLGCESVHQVDIYIYTHTY